jgi:hypothetical protein
MMDADEISINCPKCHASFLVPQRMVGKHGPCPQCMIFVPFWVAPSNAPESRQYSPPAANADLVPGSCFFCKVGDATTSVPLPYFMFKVLETEVQWGGTEYTYINHTVEVPHCKRCERMFTYGGRIALAIGIASGIMAFFIAQPLLEKRYGFGGPLFAAICVGGLAWAVIGNKLEGTRKAREYPEVQLLESDGWRHGLSP